MGDGSDRPTDDLCARLESLLDELEHLPADLAHCVAERAPHLPVPHAPEGPWAV